MARKTNNEVSVERTFSQLEVDKLNECKVIIADCQERAEGLAQTIAGQLYIVSVKKLYEIEDYKTVHEWAMETFDIAKGTVSDSINTFERFGDGTTGNLLPQWAEYSFSTLMRMKGLTDEQIEKANITPTLSRSQVIDAIKGLKALEEKEKDLPRIEAEWQKVYKDASKVFDTEERLQFITDRVPEFLNKEYQTTAADYELLTLDLTSAIDLKAVTEELHKYDGAYEEYVKKVAEELSVQAGVPLNAHEMDEMTDIATAVLVTFKHMGEADDIEELESSAVEHVTPEKESSVTEHEEPETMPYVVVNINDYRNGNGSLNKKELLARLWEEIQKVENSEMDLLVQKTE